MCYRGVDNLGGIQKDPYLDELAIGLKVDWVPEGVTLFFKGIERIRACFQHISADQRAGCRTVGYQRKVT